MAIGRCTRRRALLRLGVSGPLLWGALAPAARADLGDKPIHFIVPYAPGGPVDLISRVLATPLGAKLNQPVLVENRPGASGAIGTRAVASAAPDGHTLLVASIADTVTIALGVKVPYDYQRDLKPVTLLGVTPFVLVTGSQSNVPDVKALIQYCKDHPGQANFGSAGTGTASHLAGELFMSSAGLRGTHVPYKGQSDATIALIGGQLTFMFANPVNALPQIRSGKLRALAVSGNERYAQLPNVPTVAEAALPGYSVDPWFGLMTTGGTPDAVVQELSGIVREIIAMPDIREKLQAIGVAARGDTPQEFASLISSEIAHWTKVVRDSNIRVQ